MTCLKTVKCPAGFGKAGLWSQGLGEGTRAEVGVCIMSQAIPMTNAAFAEERVFVLYCQAGNVRCKLID